MSRNVFQFPAFKPPKHYASKLNFSIAVDSSEVGQSPSSEETSVMEPLLANLFLHYGLDKLLEKNYPQVRFVRYADDAVVHCKYKAEAKQVLTAIKARMEQIA